MKTTIAVFFGGRSTEHEISVISANQAMAAIPADKYDVIPVYITKDGHWFTGDALRDVRNFRDTRKLLEQCTEVYMRPVFGDYNIYRAKKKMFGSDIVATADLAIPVLHGSNGEDGIFEGVLETIGIPYAGCDTLASANGMDKITMKQILQSEGIPVVDYCWFTDKQWDSDRDKQIHNVESRLGYPVIVKPANLGSSVGIGRAANREELIERVEDAQRYSTRIIVEHMVEHLQEINCSVLGDCDEYITSVLEEPIKSGDFLTYEDKYMGGTKGTKGMQASEKRFPADLPDAETKRIQELAGETFRVLSCHGVSRVDMIVDRDDRAIYVNEINTIPGSLSFYLWEGSGIPFAELMERLVRLALKRKREASAKTVSYDQNIFSLGAFSGTKGSKGTK
ncbi:MAG: D-alanine--D-alanine ligase [Muribaculaceae bacterium]|nr:D-alanine--D-alanine ligase [Muribaculaceae bacterium]